MALTDKYYFMRSFTTILCIFFFTSFAFNIYFLENQVVITHPTEYHFNVDSLGYTIYTEDMKEVGRLNYGDNHSLDSLINADNQ